MDNHNLARAIRTSTNSIKTNCTITAHLLIETKEYHATDMLRTVFD